MKRYLASFILCLSIILTAVPQAGAADMDALIDMLVEKGVLTPSEAADVAYDTADEDEKADKIYHKIKWKGDVRLRYQYTDLDGSARARHHERVRLRLAGEAPVTDQVDVGWRIATGGGSARSTNETLDSTFTTKALDIDWVYAEYAPWDWLALTGGKFSNKTAVWTSGDVLWDSDLSFEGAAANLHYTFERWDAAMWWFKGGFYMLEEEAGANDPYLIVAQPGIDIDLSDDLMFKGGVAYYGFPHAKRHAPLTGSSGTNTTSGGFLAHEFQVWSIDGQFYIKLNELTDQDVIPDLILFGMYSRNTDPGSDEAAYQIGVKLGHKKVRKRGEWQIAYNYRRVEADAFPDAFPDADTYTGDTNVKGSEVIFEYGLLDNVVFGLDYYHTKPISGSSSTAEEDLMQADILFLF